ncbi:hypothetical protein [Paraburkholderia acidisoli]|uniref:Uncharacterized protein n=1 Tax=Paraburkholderia acidisoli TaxID=2571748 RepID=A0A7Z2JI76_9BURK|nr:hypothetical protein [Paraburkholderia acidisoli]QGZ64040.1 hypothetical protein FAZ98_20085 [Paraburkholderia acidisoli]
MQTQAAFHRHDMRKLTAIKRFDVARWERGVRSAFEAMLENVATFTTSNGSFYARQI